MAEKPTIKPTWSTNENYLGGPDIGTPTKIDPGAGKRNEGWRNQDRPPAQHWNFFANLQGQWFEWLESAVDGVTRGNGLIWTALDPAAVGFRVPPNGGAAPAISIGYGPNVGNFGPQWICAARSTGAGTPSEPKDPIWTSNTPHAWLRSSFAPGVIGNAGLGRHPKCMHWSDLANMWIYPMQRSPAPGVKALFTSANGVSWVARTTTPSDFQGHYSIAESPNIIVVTSDNGTATEVVAPNFFSSVNGFTWTARLNPTGREMRCVAWSPKLTRFIALGDSTPATSNAATSANGITWTAITVPSDTYNDIIWDTHNEVFVAVADSGRVITSSNGTTWQNRGVVLIGVNNRPIYAGSVASNGRGVILAAGSTRVNALTAVSMSTDGGATWKALNVACSNGLSIESSLPPFNGGVRFLGDRFWLFGKTSGINADHRAPALAYTVL